MFEDDVQRSKTRGLSLKPCEHQIVCINEVVEALDRHIAIGSKLCESDCQLLLIVRMDSDIQIGPDRVRERFPRVEHAVAHTIVVQLAEQDAEQIRLAPLSNCRLGCVRLCAHWRTAEE